MTIEQCEKLAALLKECNVEIYEQESWDDEISAFAIDGFSIALNVVNNYGGAIISNREDVWLDRKTGKLSYTVNEYDEKKFISMSEDLLIEPIS